MDPQEFELLKGMMEEPMGFVRANVSVTTSGKPKLTRNLLRFNFNSPTYMMSSTSTARFCPSIPSHLQHPSLGLLSTSLSPLQLTETTVTAGYVLSYLLVIGKEGRL
jgi:hypothetical protein